MIEKNECGCVCSNKVFIAITSALAITGWALGGASIYFLAKSADKIDYSFAGQIILGASGVIGLAGLSACAAIKTFNISFWQKEKVEVLSKYEFVEDDVLIDDKDSVTVYTPELTGGNSCKI